jgi:hypothetical protein
MEHGPLRRHGYLIAQAKTVMAVGVVADDALMVVRKNSIKDGVISVVSVRRGCGMGPRTGQGRAEEGRGAEVGTAHRP